MTQLRQRRHQRLEHGPAGGETYSAYGLDKPAVIRY
jgi:hypothetical protein